MMGDGKNNPTDPYPKEPDKIEVEVRESSSFRVNAATIYLPGDVFLLPRVRFRAATHLLRPTDVSERPSLMRSALEEGETRAIDSPPQSKKARKKKVGTRRVKIRRG